MTEIAEIKGGNPTLKEILVEVTDGAVQDDGEEWPITLDEIRQAFVKLKKVTESIEALARDLERLRESDLEEQDLKDLIWARNHHLNKSEVDKLFEGIDRILTDIEDEKGRDELLVNLLSRVSSVPKTKTRTTLRTMYALSETYGPK